jgi:hypothetical protein
MAAHHARPQSRSALRSKPPALMRACKQTTREKGIQHSKVFLRHFSDGSGCVYIGSHNFSPAAWGSPRRLKEATEERAGGGQVLWVANYECGVLRVHPPGTPAEPAWWSGLQQQLGFKPGSRRLDGRTGDEDSQPATQAHIRQLAAEMYASYAAEAPPPELDDNARFAVVGVSKQCEWRACATSDGDSHPTPASGASRAGWTQTGAAEGAGAAEGTAEQDEQDVMQLLRLQRVWWDTQARRGEEYASWLTSAPQPQPQLR